MARESSKSICPTEMKSASAWEGDSLEAGPQPMFIICRNVRMGGSIPDVAIRASFRIEEVNFSLQLLTEVAAESSGRIGRRWTDSRLKSSCESVKSAKPEKVLSPEAVKILLDKLDSKVGGSEQETDRRKKQLSKEVISASCSLPAQLVSERNVSREDELRKQLQEAASVLRSSVKRANPSTMQKEEARFVCPACGWKEDSARKAVEVKQETQTFPVHKDTKSRDQNLDTPANLRPTPMAPGMSDAMYFSEWTGASANSHVNSNRIKKILKFDETANRQYEYAEANSQSQTVNGTGAFQISDSQIYPPPDLLAQLDQELAKSRSCKPKKNCAKIRSLSGVCCWQEPRHSVHPTKKLVRSICET
eukprot:749450-Hanusia_phi.AAC.2